MLGPEIVALPAEPLEQLHLERLKGAPGFATPAHVHHLEDELFYVLGGALQVTCGDRTWEAGAGALVFLPKGRPHQFVVWGGSRRACSRSPRRPSSSGSWPRSVFRQPAPVCRTPSSRTPSDWWPPPPATGSTSCLPGDG